MPDANAYRFILLERDGIAWRLTFNRPARRNALTQAMMAEIGDAVDRVAADAQARALVLRGAGGAFSAGGDLGAMSELPPQPASGADPLVAQYRMFGDVLAKLNALPKAVIAVVEGPAVGGGFGMACCADVVILARSARFGIPEPRAGFIPSQILPFLVRRLGEGAVRHLAVTGSILDARAARRLGLGQYLCASDASIEQTLEAVLGDVARMEPDALATVKRLTLACATSGDAAVMDAASAELARLLRRPEAGEGMAAFLAKTRPAWAK
ncbi:MAG TPA: enoyl-CoA hydratase-related protein [Burkholderiales bacterium]